VGNVAVGILRGMEKETAGGSRQTTRSNLSAKIRLMPHK